MSVKLPESTKETFLDILRRAASEDRSVIEFKTVDGELRAMDITEHVGVLEGQDGRDENE